VSVCTCNSTVPINNFCSMLHFFPERTRYKQRRHSESTANVSFLVLFLSVHCLPLTVCVFCFPKNLQLDYSHICQVKSEDWTQSMQDAIPHCCFYVIKVHDLKASFPAVPGGQKEKLWREFFTDPSQWWDHRPEKVPEHQSSQSSDVNGTIALVGVNLVPLSWLLFSTGLNLTEILFCSFTLVG
jgi:hypothetical protein